MLYIPHVHCCIPSKYIKIHRFRLFISQNGQNGLWREKEEGPVGGSKRGHWEGPVPEGKEHEDRAAVNKGTGKGHCARKAHAVAPLTACAAAQGGQDRSHDPTYDTCTTHVWPMYE